MLTRSNSHFFLLLFEVFSNFKMYKFKISVIGYIEHFKKPITVASVEIIPTSLDKISAVYNGIIGTERRQSESPHQPFEA